MVVVIPPGARLDERRLWPAADAGPSLMLVLDDVHSLRKLTKLCAHVRRWHGGDQAQWAWPEAMARERPFARLVGRLLSEQWPRDLDQAGMTMPTVDELDVHDPFDALMLALMAIEALWSSPVPLIRAGGDGTGKGMGHNGIDNDNALALYLALDVPGTSLGNETRLRFDRPVAAAWLHAGSVDGGISVGTVIKGARWAAAVVGLVRSRSAEEAARKLVRDTRDRAEVTSQVPLPRLDDLQPGELADLRSKRVLVVLLHGLFASDIGTFDGLLLHLTTRTPDALVASLSELAAGTPPHVRAHHGIDDVLAALRRAWPQPSAEGWTQLQTAEFLRARVGFVGWPHDALAGIDANALELAARLHNQFRDLPLPIMFVGHSRGGVLARAAALKLAATNAPQAAWRDRVRGIATFGSPHVGAGLVEPGGKGGRELLTYLMMLSATGTAASLSDVLTLLNARVLEGIEDIKPFNASTLSREESYVKTLLERETACQWPNGSIRPDLVAVGGRIGEVQREGWRRRALAAFVERKLGHDDHDMVVETRSALGDGLVQPLAFVEVTADHHGYFERSGEPERAMDVVAAFVLAQMGPELAAWDAELTRRAQQRRELPETATFRLKPRAPSGGDDKA